MLLFKLYFDDQRASQEIQEMKRAWNELGSNVSGWYSIFLM